MTSNRADTIELLACPFCDGEGHKSYDHLADLHIIGCVNCGNVMQDGLDEAEAIAAWNTRSPSTRGGVGGDESE